MAVYCIDDGGDGTQTNTTQTLTTLDWTKADTTIANLIAYDAAAFTTSGNVIYFGDDHNDAGTGAHRTITGPSSGLPVILISADRTQSTATYKVGTGSQFLSTDGAYDITFDGSFSLHGILIASGRDVIFANDANEAFFTSGVTVKPANGRSVQIGNSFVGSSDHRNLTINLAADIGSTATDIILNNVGGGMSCQTLTILNGSNRTGQIFSGSQGNLIDISGGDLTSCTGAGLDLCDAASGLVIATNIKTPATFSLVGTVTNSGGKYSISNVGSVDAPPFFTMGNYWGAIASTTSVYRTGGATIEGTGCAWLVTTSTCSENIPFTSPWIYGTIASTGSKTFDLYITNDTADFTDAEVWLEVEYFATADVPTWTIATDQRATITTTAAAQTDDTSSTWNGAGPAFTYKQKLSVTATVNEEGQYRARVAVGVASIASSRYFYIDPKVTVT